MKNNYLHLGFGEYAMTASVIGIFKSSCLPDSKSCGKTAVLTDRGFRYTELRSETLLGRVSGKKNYNDVYRRSNE
ncbi:MAG: hypothetical protein PHW04_04540 [Candidatus Wallbacteria bacterium]|nr:hypothetical protein [Candidatus Wallbacteria bacterium]